MIYMVQYSPCRGKGATYIYMDICLQYTVYTLYYIFTYHHVIKIIVYALSLLLFLCVSLFLSIHPWNLTWNLKRSPWKRRFLLETIIFRFHVKFRGSTCNSMWFPTQHVLTHGTVSLIHLKPAGGSPRPPVMCQVRWDSVLSRTNRGIGWVLVCAVMGFIIIVVMILIMMNLIMMQLEFFIRSICHVSSWFMFCQRSSLSYYNYHLFPCLTRPAVRKESEFQEMFRSRNFLTTCLWSFYVKFP